MNRKTYSGFTLTELLVTIGIICVLAALVGTALQRARSKARGVKCLVNLRQLGIALNQFATANDAYPLNANPGFFQGENEAHVTSWKGALAVGGIEIPEKNAFTYEYSSGVWVCPQARKPENWPSQRGYSDFGYNAYGLGDRDNGLGLGGVNESTNRVRPVRVSEITAPTELIALGDAFVGWDNIVEDGKSIIWRNPSAADFLNSTKRATERHGGKANLVYVDGHAAASSLTTLFSGRSEMALKSWNRDNKAHFERVLK